ncbi:hypothetical protein FB45DRAFT_70295 [Roridomyces roridus]|uniref:NAD(P)-binding protein n=1 Tax=Roridomyces roridus TaxID=1738132 RepID=A0AAD7BMM6_9AGAR|nr:hypothetical protein FB45DRAFT_70295 [Roridomyces roridus]
MGHTGSSLRFLFFTFLPDQFLSNLPEIDRNLTGRTFLITGSNTGLGLAAAIHLARLKASHLILGVRDLEKGAKAKEQIIALTEYTGTIDVWELDMSKFESVKRFAEQAKTLGRLDGAILNAGIPTPQRWEVTSDGWEKLLQVNGIATGLLGVLLLPLLQTTTKLPPPHPDASQMLPHMTITGSAAMFLHKFPEKHAPNVLKALNDISVSPRRDRYPVTKLFNLFIARAISKLPQAQGVVVNCVDPGMCKSDFGRDRKLGPVAAWIYKTVCWTTAKGAINMVWAVLRPTAPGAFVTSCEVRQPPKWACSKDGFEVQQKVWDEMVEVWRGVSPEVDDIVKV